MLTFPFLVLFEAGALKYMDTDTGAIRTSKKSRKGGSTKQEYAQTCWQIVPLVIPRKEENKTL